MTMDTNENLNNDLDASEPIAPAEFAAPAPPYSPPAAQPAPAPGRHSHAAPIAIAIIASLVLGGLAGVTGGYFAYNGLASSESATGDSSATEPTQVQLVSGTTDEVVAAVAAVGLPSVVDVYVSGDGSANSSLPSTHPDVLVEGEGSGVAYKSAEDGGTYIITNQHVVDGATTITVTDAAGDTYDGEVVGEDTESDIAVIHVDAQIPVIEIGDSDALVVGELVVAIGSPYGFEQSVTSGVVSALHRSITDFGGDEGEYPYVDAIQTDAAINPGNSGGALLNSDAQLVGIPAAIYTETGSSAGVALAIPVNRATQVADQLIGGDAVDTPFLGVLGQTVTSDLATEEGLPVEEGAYVVEVTAGTEADKAGIQAGDVIVALDGDKIRSMDDLILKVRQRSVGDSVTVTLWRDGEKTTIDMTIGAKPAADTQG
jgi:putative serine protease PepD